MKITLLLKTISLFVLVSFIFINITYAQKIGDIEYVSITFTDGNQKVVNFTDQVKARATQTLQKQVGKNLITIKFEAELQESAENIANKLEEVILETQKLLLPLEIQNLKLYLLNVENVPANYKMSEFANGEKFYLHLFAFKDKEELNLNNCKTNKLCSIVYDTISHELTHTALDEIISRKQTRWFDEGIAEYVGNQVLEKFAPAIYKDKIESSVPSITLNRNDIREHIWGWNEAELNNFLKTNQKQLSNILFYYAASYQLIKEINSESEKNNVEKPINLLLTEMVNVGKQMNTLEIISVIQNKLKVDPKSLGKLSKETELEFINEALGILSQKDIDAKKKNYALNILAGIEKVKLSNKLIKYLLNEFLLKKQDDVFTNQLIATSLFVRFDDNEFDKTLSSFLNENVTANKMSVKKIKKQIEINSIR